MEKFINHTGTAALLLRGNIDTDQIISKEHLKSIRRTGYGKHLFSDWRYFDNGQTNPAFELNKPEYKNATFLVTGNNFGCGSSREHAVWAIVQYGFKAVIAPKREDSPAFADIFKNNSSKNGLLLVELSETEINDIAATLSKNPLAPLSIDLANQNISLEGKTFHFAFDSAVKQKFLEGLDDIGTSEKYADAITQFEKTHSPQIF